MKNRTDKFCKAQSAILVEKFNFVKKLGRGHGACVNARNPMENGSQQKVAHKKRQVALRRHRQVPCMIMFARFYMGARLSIVFCGFTFSLPEGSRWIAAILR